MRKFLSNQRIIVVGTAAFCLGLGLLAGAQLRSLQAAAVGLGIALGVSIGILTGIIMSLLMQGQRQKSPDRVALHSGEEVVAIVLDTEEAERLLQLLEQVDTGESITAGGYTVPASRRQITVVGGARFEDDET